MFHLNSRYKYCVFETNDDDYILSVLIANFEAYGFDFSSCC